MVQNPKHHVLAGPLGNHVYAMQFDHYTDQMWICTENGISIYQCSQTAAAVASRAVDPPGSRPASVLQPQQHRWHYITQANGLPMNPDSMAFGQHGTVYVGTQCGGLAIGTPRQGSISVSDNALGWSYYQWNVIKGPWHMPLTATGNGLPGNLINSVTTTWPHHMAVATDEGIALGRCVGVHQSAATAQSAMFSRGPGARASSAARTVSSLNIHLTFEHGQNFVAKVHGLWHPPAHWNRPPGRLLAQLPTEDHTTVVAWQSTPAAVGHPARRESQVASSSMGKAGYLWMGHWRTGLDVWQYNAQGRIINLWQIHRPQVGNYIQSLLPLKGGAMAVGCYGKGLKIITLPGQSRDAWKTGGGGNKANAGQRMAMATAQAAAANAPEPRDARPPSARELTAIANAIRKDLIKSKGEKQPRIVPLPDDWRTEGNWLGRYGKYWMCLFAAKETVGDVAWGPGPRGVEHVEFDGPHVRPGDSIRYWIQTLYTHNSRALQIPPVYYQMYKSLHGHSWEAGAGRRASGIDDHGETYPTWWQGPDEDVILRIPAGRFVLSLYEWNYNGHTGGMRQRDYPIAVQSFPANWRYYWASKSYSYLAKYCYAKPAKAVGRSADTWGGEWIKFLVRGPQVVVIRIERNASLNAHLLGMALDMVNEHPEPYYYGQRGWHRRMAFERGRRRALFAGLVAGPLRHSSAPGSVATEDLLLYRDQTAWATSEAFAYGAALRRLADRSGNHSRLATRSVARAQYRLAMFGRWQVTEGSLGLITPGQVEAAIRWNRVNYTYRYFEFQVIRRYLRGAAVKSGRRKAIRKVAVAG